MTKLIKGVNDLATTNPELAKQWHPTKNGDLKPTDVTCGSGKKVWWICAKGHEWKTRVVDRTNGYGCPICAGKHVLIGYNDLATLNLELAKQWHPTKNGILTPAMFTVYCCEKICWVCSLGHEWFATINNRSKGRGCPTCSKINRRKNKS